MLENESRSDERSFINGDMLATLTAANLAWPESARQQMMAMVDQIAKSNEHIQRIGSTDQSIPVKGGFAFEEMHTETYNLESILQGKMARAITDKYNEWPAHGMKPNDPATDIAVVEDSRIIQRIQAKVYQNSQQTANSMRETRDGIPYYEKADNFLGPSDQVNPSDGSPSIADCAHRTHLKNAETRPKVAEAAVRVEERLTGRLEHDHVKSRPVSKHEAREVAKDSREGKDLRSDYQGGYMTKSTIQQMQRAAASAAGIAAVIAGTINTVQYLRLVREGKITTGQAVQGIIKNTAVASADSALKAAAATGVVFQINLTDFFSLN